MTMCWRRRCFPRFPREASRHRPRGRSQKMSSGLLSRAFDNWIEGQGLGGAVGSSLRACLYSSFGLRTWFQQFGVEAFVYLPLVSWVAIRLERGDQGAEARREND